MKYKHIDSMLHNFGHSFVSLMNYVDDEYIIDLLPSVAASVPGNEININFSQRTISPPFEYPMTLVKSVNYWADSLTRHIESHNVETSRLSDIHLRFRQGELGYEVVMSTVDDRGQSHNVLVRA